jgi:hypothetical protein
MKQFDLYRSPDWKYVFDDGSTSLFSVDDQVFETRFIFGTDKFSFAKPFLNGAALVEFTDPFFFDLLKEEGDIDLLLPNGHYFLESHLLKDPDDPFKDQNLNSPFLGPKYRKLQEFLKLYKENDETWKTALKCLGGDNHKYHRYCMTDGLFLVNLSLKKIMSQYKNWENFVAYFSDTFQFKVPEGWEKYCTESVEVSLSSFWNSSLFFYLKSTPGKMIAYGPFEDASLFYRGMAPIKEFGHAYGYLDDLEAFRYRILPQYDIAFPFSEELARVGKDGKFGFIDLSGELKIGLNYDDARSFRSGWAAVAKIQERYVKRAVDKAHAMLFNKYENEDYGLRWFFIDQNGQIAKNYIFGIPFSSLRDVDPENKFEFEIPFNYELLNESYGPFRLGKFEDASLGKELNSNDTSLLRSYALLRGSRHLEEYKDSLEAYFAIEKNQKSDEFRLHKRIDSFRYYTLEFDASLTDKLDLYYTEYIRYENYRR